jgi:hypothetical protein
MTIKEISRNIRLANFTLHHPQMRNELE